MGRPGVGVRLAVVESPKVLWWMIWDACSLAPVSNLCLSNSVWLKASAHGLRSNVHDGKKQTHHASIV